MLETLALSWKVTERHWAVYRQNLFANIIPTVVDPILFLVSFGVGLGAYLQNVEGMSYLGFIAPGLAISSALFTAFFETSYNFYVRYTFEHIYKAMLTTPLGVGEIIMGELTWVFLKGLGMSFGVSTVLALFGGIPWPALPALAFIGAFVALGCGGLGLVASALVSNINQFQTVYALLISPMFFFSGIFFPLDKLPEAAQMAALLSPLYHGVRLAQDTAWGQLSFGNFGFHGGLLALTGAILVGIAVRLISKKLYS